jgi:hypothetical protein
MQQFAIINSVTNHLSNTVYCHIHICPIFPTNAGKSQVQSWQALQVQHHQLRLREGGQAAKEQGESDHQLQEQVH